MENKQLFGVAGGLMLLTGMFAPAITLGLPVSFRFIPFPVSVSISYFKYSATVGGGEWILLIGLATAALLLALTRMYLGLLFTGITSLGILGFTIFDLQQKQEFLLHFLPQSMLGGVTQITDLLSTLFIQFDWGCLLLVCGPILMIAAALLQPTRRGNRRPPPAMLPYVVCRTCSMASPIGKSFCANCGARLQVLPVDYVAPSLPIDQRRSTAQPSALRNMPPHP